MITLLLSSVSPVFISSVMFISLLLKMNVRPLCLLFVVWTRRWCLRPVRNLACTDSNMSRKLWKRRARRRMDGDLRRQSSNQLFSASSYGQHLLSVMDSICFLMAKKHQLSKNISLSNSTGWKLLVWTTHWGGITESTNCTDTREFPSQGWSWTNWTIYKWAHIYLSWSATQKDSQFKTVLDPNSVETCLSSLSPSLFSLSSQLSFTPFS